MAYIPYRPRTVVIEVCLSLNFDVVFFKNAFLFSPSKSKLIGDVLMNRKTRKPGAWFFSLSFITRFAYWRTESSCVSEPSFLLSLSFSIIQKIEIIQDRGEHFSAFCLVMGTSAKNWALLGENGNTLK